MDFSEIKDTVLDIIESLDKKMLIIISGLILIILICILLLVIVVSNNKKTKVTTYTPALVLSEKLYIPESPNLPKDYTISRKTKDKWSDEETEKWFTIPTEKDISSLSSTNDRIVNNIIEAAP